MEDMDRRRTRPESSASSHIGRMTPSSSNSSAANLGSLRNGNTNSNASARGSTGGASLLQERLRERKVESARQSRRRSVDMSAAGDRGVQSSPVKASLREERRPSSGGMGSGKGLGVKQIEEVCLFRKVLEYG